MPAKNDLVQLGYTLMFSTLFHCGTGMRTGLIDRSVIRDADSYLYVPGSTFKGTLRERCEQLGRLYDPREQRANEGCWGNIPAPHDKAGALPDLGNVQPTMVTRIFGSQTTPGRLFFDDARLSEEDQTAYGRSLSAEREGDGRAERRDYKALQVDMYTQVRLDRRTRTAAPGALYTSEFGTRDLTFKGTILGRLECSTIEAAALRNERRPDLSPTYSLLLLLAGLRLLDRLGGNKSSGKGQCQCEITELRLNGQRIDREIWLSWLEHLRELAGYYASGRAGA